MYPFMALICAVFVYYVFLFLKNKVKFRKEWITPIILIIYITAIFYGPYLKIIKKTVHPPDPNWHKDKYHIENFIRDGIRNKYDLTNQYILHNGYNPALLFYANILNDQGKNVNFKRWENLEPRDVVIAHQDNVKESVEMNYLFEIQFIKKNIKIYKINGKK